MEKKSIKKILHVEITEAHICLMHLPIDYNGLYTELNWMLEQNKYGNKKEREKW